MKILITGSAGFIGFNFCKHLLQNSNYHILGIDNLSDYYDVNLKKKELKAYIHTRDLNFKKLILQINLL